MPNSPTVAIVDDDEAVREALGDLLMVSGLACHKFAGAAFFLAALEDHRFDCVITDIRMPGMSGIDLIERLREEGIELPVVVLSSVREEQARKHALALGVRAWFTKPVSDEELLTTLGSVIGEDLGPDVGS